MITHAKVRYEDDRKLAVVNIRDIEKFPSGARKRLQVEVLLSSKMDRSGRDLGLLLGSDSSPGRIRRPGGAGRRPAEA